ncbi:MAG: hypothetical protein GY937_07090 [bacterium]|nr:hypothetical protein [bacterium]
MARELGVEDQIPTREQQDLDEVGFSTSDGYWVGDESPYSASDLASMPGPVLLDLLSNWSHDDDSAAGTRGLEEALRQAVAEGGADALHLCRELIDAPFKHGFVVACLRGLRARCEASDDADWQEPTEVAVACVMQSASSERSVEAASSISDRVRVVREGTELLALLVQRDGPSDFAEDVHRAAEAALRLSFALETRPALSLENRVESLVTSSLNSLVGDVVRLVVQIGLWEYRQNRPAAADDAEDWLHSRLESLLEHAGLSREIVLSVIGRHVPQLLLIAPTWTRERLPTLFRKGAVRLADTPCWSTFAVTSSYSSESFREFRHLYLESVSQFEEPDERSAWAPLAGLRRHVLIAVVRGDCAVGDVDGIVEAFFPVTPDVGNRIYWGLYSAWKDAGDTLDSHLPARLVSFWEWRLDVLEAEDHDSREADDLLWFFLLPQLVPREALPLGTRTLRLAGMRPTTGRLLWDRLSAVTSAEPTLAVDLVEALVEVELAADHLYLPRAHVEACLRTLLDSDESRIADRARRLVHQIASVNTQKRPYVIT